MRLRHRLRIILTTATLSLLYSTHALAAFHLWVFSEVYSNADGTIQFIEFSVNFDGENFVAGIPLTSNSTSGYVLPCCDLVGSTANRRFLVATQGFAALSGAVTPDYIMPDNFISVNAGDTLRLVGADTFTFSAAQFPTDGVLSLSKNFLTGTNSPTNFAGSSGSINVPSVDTTNVFVEFGAGTGGFGTEGVPFGTLIEALLIITGSDPTINIAPGSTTQTFPGGFAISIKVRLLNTGSETVTIGAAPQALKSNPSGFHTRPSNKSQP